ncbi:MAG: hypothetical protein Fur002_03350 [Anaerolineales bacterium]
MNRGLLYPALSLILLCAALGALAGFRQPRAAALPSATPAAFGYVEIVKPTYTPSPTVTPSPPPTATPLPPETPYPFARAEIIKDTPAPELQVAPLGRGGKLILVDISEQHMYVYEGDALVYSFVASTGMNNATRVGTFSVLNKIPNAYGATWDIWMPNWLGIYWAGSLQNGIHALPILPNGGTLWAGYLGSPISYGCVVLGTYEAQLLYDWAEVGATVEIQW